MSEGTRKFKMPDISPLPNCQKCPWEVWCSKLNFGVMNPKKERTKVCPFWWMLMEMLRDKGIMKPPMPSPPPVGSEEARAIMDAMRRKRIQGLGMTA